MTEEVDLEKSAVLDEEKKAQLKKVMSKEAKSGRKLTGFWNLFINLLGVVMVVYYFYSVGVEPADTQFNRGIYVLLTYVMILLCFPFSSRSNPKRPTIWDIFMALVALAAVGYFILEFENFNYRSGAETPIDFWMSIVGILISLEVCRRVLGWSLLLVGIFFVLYGLYGRVFPEPFTHRGFSFDRLAVSLFMEQSGVFGVMANVLVTYVVLFIFFGSFLQKSGVGRFFIDWPLALAGKTVGGPAKVSVIASAFFGSVSGSAIANTVSTGAFTIPLMKRAGFKPHVAGAIEPSASIGGMFMPPIMGAGGFLMAELTNTPYKDIMIMAIFPAVLYFFSVMSMIHFEAKKRNIQGLVDDEFEPARVIFKKYWYKSLPLVIIVFMMLWGFSPGMSAFWATISCVFISWFDKEYRMLPDRLWLVLAGLGAAFAFWALCSLALGLWTMFSVIGAVVVFFGVMYLHPDDRRWFTAFWGALVGGARSTLVIGATVGVIGIIVGTIALTGIGLKFSDIIIHLSNGYLPLAILLIGIASLVLGMGVPVTASYLITAVLAVPALIDMMGQMGIPGHTAGSMAIAAHMIVYWFSQDSNITPPVCVAAYAGAAIAGSDPWKTGWTSFKFAKLLYVVPFLFAYDPSILLFYNDKMGFSLLTMGDYFHIMMGFGTAIVGTLAFSALTMGYLIRRTTVLEWIIFAFGTLLCFQPSYMISDMVDNPDGLFKAIFDAAPTVQSIMSILPQYTLSGMGVILFVIVYSMQKAKNKRDAARIAAPA